MSISIKDALKLLVLILVPVNTWLVILYYINRSKATVLYPSFARYESETKVRISYFQEKWGIKEGRKLLYPFPFRGRTFVFCQPPPFGQGKPVLFLNIGWIAYPEVWEPAIKEALSSSPDLLVVLLYRLTPIPEAKELQERFRQETELIQNMLKYFSSPRVSAIASERMHYVFGLEIGGILAVICDGQGIVRVVEFYPSLKRIPRWSEEVADWRTKLRQAVKRALERFYGKAVG
ncbi:MAG: hypothetical protein HZLCBSQH_001779 [Candidatus Fervidibacterota bacterium]